MMKKNELFLIVLAVISMVACGKTGNEGGNLEEGTLTLKKAALSSGQKLSWKEGECVKVFDSKGTVFDTRATQDCEQLKFNSKLKEKPLFILAGPETIRNAGVSGGREFTLESSALINQSGTLEGGEYLAARTSGSNVTVQHVFGYVCCTLPRDISCKSLELKSTVSESLAASKVTVTFDESACPVVSFDKASSSDRIQTSAHTAGSTVWFSIIPGTYSGFEITMVKSDGSRSVSSVAGKYTVKAGDVLDAGEIGGGGSVAATFDGKKVAFVGNSMIYYCGVVVYGGQKSTDTGLFYQLCKQHGWNTTVYDFTWGGKQIYQRLGLDPSDPSLKTFGVEDKAITSTVDYVFFCDATLADNEKYYNSYVELAKVFNKPGVKYYYLVAYYNCNSDPGSIAKVEQIINKFRVQGYDVELVRWGQLAQDLVQGTYKLQGSNYKYSKTTFQVTQNTGNRHPNPLSGYMCVQTAFTQVTGLSAVGQDYSFCENALYGSDGKKKGYDGFYSNYYVDNSSNFRDIMKDSAEMRRLQAAIDIYAKK